MTGLSVQTSVLQSSAALFSASREGIDTEILFVRTDPTLFHASPMLRITSVLNETWAVAWVPLPHLHRQTADRIFTVGQDQKHLHLHVNPQWSNWMPSPLLHIAPPDLRSGSCTHFSYLETSASVTSEHFFCSPYCLLELHMCTRPSVLAFPSSTPAPLQSICDCFQRSRSEAYHGLYQSGSSPAFRDNHVFLDSCLPSGTFSRTQCYITLYIKSMQLPISEYLSWHILFWSEKFKTILYFPCCFCYML